MRIFLAALAAFMVLALPTAQAETLDLSTLKCSELATVNDEEGTVIFIWLLGYVGGQLNSTLLNLDEMEAFGTKVGEYCASNPDVGLVAGVMDLVRG